MRRFRLFFVVLLILLIPINVSAEGLNYKGIINFYKNDLFQILRLTELVKSYNDNLAKEVNVEVIEDIVVEISKGEHKDISEETIEEKSDEVEESAKKEEDSFKKEEVKKTSKVVYLTFDDGPSENTIKILDILKEHNVKATFFVNGNNSSFAKEIYKRIVNEGHAIGNHTYTHNYVTQYSSVEAFMKDLNRLNTLLKEVVNIEPDIMRFPGGSNNTVSRKYGGKTVMKEIKNHLKEAKPNMVYYDWNVDSGDANGKKLTSDDIANNVINGTKTKSRAIVLMHDSKPKVQTVNALNKIITELKSLGYSFETLTSEVKPVQFQ